MVDFTAEGQQLLPPVGGGPVRATAYVAGGALVSWRAFWFCVFPIVVSLFVIGIGAGIWWLSAAIGGIAAFFAVWWPITFCYFRHNFQLWALQRPDNLLVRGLMPLFEVLDSDRTGNSEVALWMRERWGNNFCSCGEVWMCSFKDVAKALTSPQARTFNLGEHPMLPIHVPDQDTGRCVFLLALSDKGATGNGDHEAFRQAVLDYFFSPEARAREDDEVSQKLFEKLAADFQSKTDFWADASTEGCRGFWIRYLHYVLFGLDPADTTAFATMFRMHGGNLPMVHYFTPCGHVLDHTEIIRAVADVYAGSPALSKYKEGDPKYHGLTRHELCTLMVCIMRLAGVQGSTMFTWLLMSGNTHGYIPVDPTAYWDALDLNDDKAVRRYIMEVCRLSTPVTVAHRVSTEPFSCEIKGKTYSFPTGTKIAIPLCLAMVDKEYWGEDAFQFNPNRKNLEESFLGFNSVGGKHAGRECPAKDLVMRTLVKILRATGKTRPRKTYPGVSPPVTKSPARASWFGTC